jgi:hypothetical protein
VRVRVSGKYLHHCCDLRRLVATVSVREPQTMIIQVSAYPPPVARWVFPPLEPGFDYVAAMRALGSEEIRPVKNQHVVSKVVLKGFASLRGRQGWQLARFDKRQCRELDPKALKACGKINDFVQYASGSAEALWHGVENRLGDAIKSAEDGTLGLKRS